MGVRVFNSKTGVSITCDAKYWADCKDHNQAAGFVLWTPAMTAGVIHIPVNNGNDISNGTVTAADYAATEDEDEQIGTCNECGEEEVTIYDTENYTCLDCYDNNRDDNEPDGAWMDEDALDSVGWGNDESYE